MANNKTLIIESEKDVLPIDCVALANICSDENMVKAVIAAILKEIPQSIRLLDQAIKAKNPADVELYAHRINGAAATVGAKRLSQKAYRLECAGEEKNMAEMESLLEQVQEEYEKMAAFLSQPGWMEAVKQQ